METINNIIVLRNDTKEAWEADAAYRLVAGEVGVGYMTRTITEGDETITTQVPIIKVGDGVHTWKELPQAEGVFENDVVLTSALGKYTIPASGYVRVPNSKGMTTSELLLDALSEVKEPTIAEPSITSTASVVGGGEMGAYITGVKWTGNFTDGSYQYGSESHPSSTATGLSASNVTWSISNDNDNQTATTEDGTFTFTSDKYKQIDSESSKTYVTVTAEYDLDASGARTPLNNVGVATDGKIASRTDKKITASASATGYRKPFWGVLTTPFAETKNAEGAVTAISVTSDDIRGLTGKGTATRGLPTTLAVPEGSRQVIFAAKAGTYSSLTAKDGNAQDATVTFSKIANAVNVEGANDYTATAYDVFEVTWGDPIASAKALKLTWG